MSPASGWVLASAAVLVSPALWLALVPGALPLDVALNRYLLVVVGCWLAFSMVVSLLPPPATPERLAPAPETTQATAPTVPNQRS